MASGNFAGKERLRAYIDGIKDLPSTPSMMIKLLALFRQSNPDIDEVVQLVSRDPSLTSEVLRTCNSARLRGDNPVADMFEAVSRLGFYQVYQIVMAAAGTRAISAKNVDYVLEVETLCRHSKATALAAGVIARAMNEASDIAFVAGLLHDIGKIVLASGEGARYRTLSPNIEPLDGSLSDAERKLFGFDHSEVGGELMDLWGLPPEVVSGVYYHHNVAGAADSKRLTAIIVLADMLANAAEQKSNTDASNVENFTNALDVLKINSADFTTIMDDVHEEFKREAVFGATAASARLN